MVKLDLNQGLCNAKPHTLNLFDSGPQLFTPCFNYLKSFICSTIDDTDLLLKILFLIIKNSWKGTMQFAVKNKQAAISPNLLGNDLLSLDLNSGIVFKWSNLFYLL